MNQMPGLDGLGTTRKLREGAAGELSRDVPVVGLTANALLKHPKRLMCPMRPARKAIRHPCDHIGAISLACLQLLLATRPHPASACEMAME